MSDPSIVPPEVIDAGTDLAKIGSGGVITLILGRFFGGQDKVIVRLDAMAATLNTMGQQLAVSAAGESRRDADVARMDAKLEALGERVARLEAKAEARE